MSHPPQILPPDDAVTAATPLSRRTALWLTSRLVMAAGLTGGYGMFAWLSGRFMLPARTGQFHQLFVTSVSDVPEGGTLVYRTPDGRTVNVTRRGMTGAATDFVALSSTCPHLGCQVSWEGQNNRYFCPCHNGTFDAGGRATGGPPKDAGQWLPRYGLRVDQGLLYILVPAEQLSLGEAAEASPPPGDPGEQA